MSAIDSAVIVYTNRDFNGTPVTLAKGKYTFQQIADQLKINDSISSIKIPPGYTATVWEHNFSGKTTTFSTDTPYVGDEFYKIISSVEVKYVPTKVEDSKNVIKFDGVGSYLCNGIPLQNQSAFTFEAWVKFFSLDNNRPIFSNCGIAFLGIKDKKIWYSRPNDYEQGDTFVDAPISIQTWYHVAFIGDRTSASIFLNGKLVKTSAVSIGGSFECRNGFHIGTCGGAKYCFAGEMSEVRIWNVARSQAEIQAGMSKRLIGTEPKLISYYPLNGLTNLFDNNFLYAMDLSGNNYHCTPYNVSVVYDDTLPLQKSM